MASVIHGLLWRHDDLTHKILDTPSFLAERPSQQELLASDRYLTFLETPPTRVNEDLSAHFARGQMIYRRIIQPLSRCLAGATTVYVLRPLLNGRLPIQALPESVQEVKGGAVRYFGTGREIYYFSGLESLKEHLAKRQATVPMKFLGVGNPKLALRSPVSGVASVISQRSVRGLEELPETETELRAIANAFGGGSQLLVQGDATKSGLRRTSLADFSVISFATHGTTRTDIEGATSPSIVLTPVDEVVESENGMLTPEEVLGLPIRAALVILSTCNSGTQQRNLAQSEIASIAGAFSVAGAQSVVATSWQIDSLVTTKMFQRFAGRLKAGETLRSAYWQTIHEMMESKNSREADPRSWGAFSVLGIVPSATVGGADKRDLEGLRLRFLDGGHGGLSSVAMSAGGITVHGSGSFDDARQMFRQVVARVTELGDATHVEWSSEFQLTPFVDGGEGQVLRLTKAVPNSGMASDLYFEVRQADSLGLVRRSKVADAAEKCWAEKWRLNGGGYEVGLRCNDAYRLIRIDIRSGTALSEKVVKIAAPIGWRAEHSAVARHLNATSGMDKLFFAYSSMRSFTAPSGAAAACQQSQIQEYMVDEEAGIAVAKGKGMKEVNLRMPTEDAPFRVDYDLGDNCGERLSVMPIVRITNRKGDRSIGLQGFEDGVKTFVERGRLHLVGDVSSNVDAFRGVGGDAEGVQLARRQVERVRKGVIGEAGRYSMGFRLTFNAELELVNSQLLTYSADSSVSDSLLVSGRMVYVGAAPQGPFIAVEELAR